MTNLDYYASHLSEMQHMLGNSIYANQNIFNFSQNGHEFVTNPYYSNANQYQFAPSMYHSNESLLNGSHSMYSIPDFWPSKAKNRPIPKSNLTNVVHPSLPERQFNNVQHSQSVCNRFKSLTPPNNDMSMSMSNNYQNIHNSETGVNNICNAIIATALLINDRETTALSGNNKQEISEKWSTKKDLQCPHKSKLIQYNHEQNTLCGRKGTVSPSQCHSTYSPVLNLSQSVNHSNILNRRIEQNVPFQTQELPLVDHNLKGLGTHPQLGNQVGSRTPLFPHNLEVNGTSLLSQNQLGLETQKTQTRYPIQFYRGFHSQPPNIFSENKIIENKDNHLIRKKIVSSNEVLLGKKKLKNCKLVKNNLVDLKKPERIRKIQASISSAINRISQPTAKLPEDLFLNQATNESELKQCENIKQIHSNQESNLGKPTENETCSLQTVENVLSCEIISNCEGDVNHDIPHKPTSLCKPSCVMFFIYAN